MFKQHVVGAELVLPVIVMGEGDNTKVKRVKQIHQFLPSNCGLALESTVSIGRMSLEALRYSGPHRKYLHHFPPVLEKQRGIGNTKISRAGSVSLLRPLLGWSSERPSWPPRPRLGKSEGQGIETKIVEKSPGQNGDDPRGVGTQV